MPFIKWKSAGWNAAYSAICPWYLELLIIASKVCSHLLKTKSLLIGTYVSRKRWLLSVLPFKLSFLAQTCIFEKQNQGNSYIEDRHHVLSWKITPFCPGFIYQNSATELCNLDIVHWCQGDCYSILFTVLGTKRNLLSVQMVVVVWERKQLKNTDLNYSHK